MVKSAIGPMILAASLFAVPGLAATQPGGIASNSPAAASPAASSPASPPAGNMSAGMPGNHAEGAMTPAGSATSQPAAPVYTTADGQLRLGKIVGASVYNDQHQSIGSVDDVLMGHDNKATTAVISVGGFLGMGGKLVSVPFDHLKVGKDRIVMPGATEQSLKSMPEYSFKHA